MVQRQSLVALVASVLLLAACGGGDAEPTAAPAAQPAAPTATATVAEPVSPLAAPNESPLETPASSSQLLPDATANADGYVDITVDQMATLLEDKNFTLVNVHIPYEGELPQTDLFLPFDTITENLDQLPDKNAPIVLYCRSGNMSTTAAEALVAQGYTNVYEVDGGFNAWAAAGYELLQNQ
jgi:rhodanese-related sulfurtransferase